MVLLDRSVREQKKLNLDNHGEQVRGDGERA